MNITILGHVCIDHNKSESATYIAAGSPAMYIARIYNKFPQTKTQIIAPFGSDFSQHIHYSSIYPQLSQGEKTLLYENRSEGNLRTQKALNREHAHPVPIDEGLIARLQTSDIVYFAPLIPTYGVDYIKTCLSYVPKNALKILLPQGYYRDFTEEDEVIQRAFIEEADIIPLFDFAIVSEQDHQDMLAIIHQWAKDIKVIMTMGDKGAMYVDRVHSYISPTKAVPVNDIIDSVGSGDIFSASFGYKYRLTGNIHKSLDFANNIARQCLYFKPDSLNIILPK
ncbi:MAG: PfkB family carbohydrate kinase [Candidatus Roizmanbacteria bacterium]|nr:PfkB family carbohydrate kinase [Candidatus Roizmanbacteria bacterium]